MKDNIEISPDAEELVDIVLNDDYLYEDWNYAIRCRKNGASTEESYYHDCYSVVCSAASTFKRWHSRTPCLEHKAEAARYLAEDGLGEG